MRNSDSTETVGRLARRPSRLSWPVLAASLLFLATWLNLQGNLESIASGMQVAQAGSQPDDPPLALEHEGINGIAHSFFRDHCLDCHGETNAEGELRLDQLEADLAMPDTFRLWQQILERVKSGEMPPTTEPRPQPQQVADFVMQLTARLDQAARSQPSEPRVVLRRLNRVEYENTLNDLFNVRVSIADMLPEDAIAQGFDNVGAALNVSPVLIERYLDAVDAVLDAAIAPVHNMESRAERFDLYDSLPTWFQAGVWKQDEGVILFRTSGNSATDLRKFRAPAPGRYRFRISASAHNSDKPLPMAVLLGNFVVSGNPTRHLGYFDAPPGPPKVIEFEERLLKKNDTIKVTPVALPSVYLNHGNMTKYPGPGLHIHWIEIEGPLAETWPSESYRRVFGEVDPKRGTLADIEMLLRAFLPKAFRRPVTDGERVQHQPGTPRCVGAGPHPGTASATPATECPGGRARHSRSHHHPRTAGEASSDRELQRLPLSHRPAWLCAGKL